MRTPRIPLLLLLAIGLGAAVPAATPATPEALVKAYSVALQAEGMSAASRFMHTDELTRFKQMLMPVIRKDAAGKNEAIPAMFGPDATLASIEAMPPARFMDGFMAMVGDKIQDASFGESEVLGSVKEKDIVHVVTRMTVKVQEIEVKSMNVISAKLDGQQWKLLLTTEIEGVLAALSAAN